MPQHAYSRIRRGHYLTRELGTSAADLPDFSFGIFLGQHAEPGEDSDSHAA